MHREGAFSCFIGKKKDHGTIRMRDWLWWKFTVQLVLKPLVV